MADKQSREVVNIGKDECGQWYVEYADGTREIAMMGADFSTGKDLSVRMDFKESITGLKAIQREARKATAALKKLDDIKKHTCPSCGKISLDINTLRSDYEVVKVFKECLDCGWEA